jgi:hypothetical protein
MHSFIQLVVFFFLIPQEFVMTRKSKKAIKIENINLKNSGGGEIKIIMQSQKSHLDLVH